MVVTINIGKKGITPGVLEEIHKTFKKKGSVSVKLLKNYRAWKERDEIKADFAFIKSYLEARVKRVVRMSITGFTALYAKDAASMRAAFRRNNKPFKPSSNPDAPRIEKNGKPDTPGETA